MDAIKQRITETLEQNYMPYAMSVIVSRAIPEIDGFKPSHRKLLYTMYKMKLLNGARTKSANVVGQTMKLNPHGDQAIYATMVRLTRGYDALLHPYVDSKGNFGKVTSRDMKFAASRYTEVKLDAMCEEIFKDIDKNTVDFVDNYDGRMKEPVLLPTRFPNILVSANRGIAVGMASNIASFNLAEVCKAVSMYIDNTEVDLNTVLTGPDFPTGGYLIYDENVLREIYSSGTGSFKLRAKYQIDPKNNCLEIIEIPYTTTVEAIIEKVIELVKLGKIKEISDIRDETDLGGLKIAIDLKRGVDAEALMAKLYRYTTLEDSFSCNFNVLINGRPKVLGVKALINEWLIFRVACLKRGMQYDLDIISDKLHLLNGLRKVLLDIDRAIQIVKDTEKDAEVVPNLMAAFGVDEVQAEFVAEIKLRNLNKDYLLNRLSEIKKLEAEATRLNNLIQSDHDIRQLIKKEQAEIAKKYGKPRKTEILHLEKVKFHEVKHEIEDFNLKLFVTAHGYIKKVSLVSLRASNIHKMKDDDVIIQELDGTNMDDLLFFTDQHQVYKMKAHEIEEHKASSLGDYISNILKMDPGENVKFVLNTKDYEGHMIYAFENGKIARVPLKSFETKTNRKKLVKAYANESPLMFIDYITEDTSYLMVRKSGVDQFTALIVRSSLIPEKASKNTVGLQVVRMKKDSSVDMIRRVTAEEAELNPKWLIEKLPAPGSNIDPMLKMSL